MRQFEYGKVLPLFYGEPLTYFAVIARAIVEGNSFGRLWADHADDPRTVLVWDGGPIVGLAGHASNAELNEALAELVTREIAPGATAKGHTVFKMFYTDGWEDNAGKVFKGASLQKRDRVLYTLDTFLTADWRDRIPSGYSIEPVDAELLGRSDLANLDRVKEEFACCWTTIDHFLRKGFGFCLVREKTIACWCTAEYASGMDRGIGIETVEEYQGRGFATLTASAFVEHCVSNGFRPYWDAWSSNLPSIAVAEKVGFKKASDYSVYVGSFAIS